MNKTKNPYRHHRERGKKWMSRIRAADARQEDWFKAAEEAEAAYAADGKSKAPIYDFNILHSNVETIVPAIYNSTPAPDVRDRFGGEDKLAKAVADIYERIISGQIDDNKLDTEIEAGAQDAFLAGRDIVRIRFDADVSDDQQQITNERISFEAVSWRDYREGPARRFEDVPWEAFLHMIPEEELEDFHDSDMVAGQKDEEPATSESTEEDIKVWEIWDKKTRKVLFIRESDGTILKEDDDPLGLVGFFPNPRPVQPIQLTGKRVPICPFDIYKKLAKELDVTTKRINAILSGLKVKGWVVGSSEDVTKLADANDNELVPISGFEGLAQTGGIDKAIVWWPVDKAIQVLRELYVSRDQTKQAIYEITGISDIVRGSSEAQETLGAQQIKTQWGSLRIKKMQRLIERQVRDLFVMSAELIASRFSPETIEKLSGTKLTNEMMALIKDPLQRYRIDVESDSTIRADLSRVKGELSEFLTGTANYFATMSPVIDQAPQSAEPIADIYASFGRLFNLGQQGEAAIEKLVDIAKQVGSQPRPNPEAEAAQATAQLEQAKLQMDGQRLSADQQRAQTELQLKLSELEAKQGLEVEKLKLAISNAQTDGEIKKVELQIKGRELQIKEAAAVLAEKQAEFDAAAKVKEMELEEKQQRAVKVG